MKTVILPLLLLTHTVWGATFGTVVPASGGLSDIVLDEARQRLYLVNSTQQWIDVYSTAQRRFTGQVPVDAGPLAAAMSRNGKYLYVTAYDAAVLDVIDLDTLTVASRVSLPAQPQGVAVGADERVLVTTPSTANATTSTMLLYDPRPGAAKALSSIEVTPPAPATPTRPPNSGDVFNQSHSRMIATPDGSLIIGINNASTSSRDIFVYETASASVLRSRSVSNISDVLSVSPDGSRFMAGLSLFDTATLTILAQQNAANASYPFPQNVNFNTQTNQGGSVFAPDGSTLYAAFNIAPVGSSRANVSQMMLSDPDNLLIQLALQLPQNLAGKMVITSDGSTIYALSQSGFTILPVSTIYSNPIAVLDHSVIAVANDQCGVTKPISSQRVTVRNAGQGRMAATAQLQTTGPASPPGLGGVTGPGGGAIGGPIVITTPGGPPIELPGDTPNTSQQTGLAGTAPILVTTQTGQGATFDFSYNPKATTSLGTVTPSDYLVQSQEAINIPSQIRVFQNNRNAEAAGQIVPIQVSSATAEGLVDIVSDPVRQRLYIANSGLNRVEVFDVQSNQLLAPVKVGQLPRSLAMTPDGRSLYVANTGGESIGVIDLDKLQVTGAVSFPPVAFNASYAVITPSVIAASLSGLQIVMSDGSLWNVVGNRAQPRSSTAVTGTATITSPRTMVSTPGGEYVLLLGGDGKAYLYDAMTDKWVLSQQIVSTPLQGYFGPVGAGPRGQYYLVNGIVLDQALSRTGAAGTGTGTSSVSAVFPISATTFARFVQPTRSGATQSPNGVPRIENAGAANGNPAGGPGVNALEGPLSTQSGTQRVNMPGRMMAVDSAGATAYLLTASGLSIIPMSGGGAGPGGGPRISNNGVVNTAGYTADLAPGSIASIFGTGLASGAAASTTPLPKVLGGTCVTIDDTAAPLFMTSDGQINLQIPPDLTAARHSLVVRSIDKHAAGNPTSIALAKAAPAAYVDPATGYVMLFHRDGRPVSRANPAKRDEPLVLYANGLGATTGEDVAAAVQVFFGDPSWKQAGVIVDWSGLAPGYIGLYQLNLRVPGFHIKGDALPVTLRVGSINSKPGTPPAIVAVE